MTGDPAIVRIVVLFQPPADIAQRLERLAESGWPVVAVYNEPDEDVLERLRGSTSAILLPQQGNQGLARAINAGIDHARKLGATHVSLFDQDSMPEPDLERRLLEAIERAGAAIMRIAAVGPRPADEKDSGRRGAIDNDGVPLSPQATIITSGSLIPLAAIDCIGSMWDELFIDDIDHEWCHRARHAGWDVVRANNVEMRHNLGDVGIQVLGRFKAIHRSPFRHYHIIRNTLAVVRLTGIPIRWRIAEGLKTLYRLPAYLMFSTDRAATLGSIFRAARDHRHLLATRPEIWRR